MDRTRASGGGVIAALIVGMLIYGLAMGTTYPLLGVVLAAEVAGLWNGLNAAATGLGLLAGVAMVPALGRRFGAGGAALYGVALMAASLMMLAATRDFWALFAARLLLGCGANMLFVTAETALNTFAAPGRRGRVMGLYTAAVAFGFVVGPAVVAATPHTPAVLLMACAAVAACAVLPLRHARGPMDGAVRPPSLGRILPAVVAFPSAFAFLLVASAVDAVAISLLPVIAKEQSYTIEAGALFVTIFHIGLLCAQPVVGAALDRFGRRRGILGCCAVCLACAGLLGFGDYLTLFTVAGLMFAWGGANYGLYTSGLALIGDRFRGEALSAATAAFAAVYAAAAIAAPILAGGALDRIGAGGFYAAVAGLYFIVLACGAVFFRPLEPTLVRR